MNYKIKSIKEFILEGLPEMSFYHGFAIAKMDISHIKKGDSGVITAYLPEMERFAVFFGNKNWITFDGNEEWFLSCFEIIQEEK